MKFKVITFDSSYNYNKEESNFITFMASKSKDLLTPTTKSSRFSKEDEDDKDSILDIYNVLLRELIKLEKSKKKALESLEKKENEFNVLKAFLEENKSLINLEHDDQSKMCEVI